MPITPEQIAAVYQTLAPRAVEIFNERGEHPPTLLTVHIQPEDEGGKQKINVRLIPEEVTALFFSQQLPGDKILSGFIRAALRPIEDTPAHFRALSGNFPPADMIVIISESWVLRSNSERTGDESIAEHPDRREALTFGMHHRGGVELGICPVRENPRRAEFAPLKIGGVEITKFGMTRPTEKPLH